MIEQLTEARQRLDLWKQWHPHVLGSKGSTDSEDLWSSVLIDVSNSLVAAHELSAVTATDLIDELHLPVDAAADIRARAVDERADHLGFRIYAPMDVYIEVLPLWTSYEGWQLVGTKRLAPSARFQERVGGAAEMAQVWIRRAEADVELELFDIHKPLGGDVGELGRVSAGLLRHGGPLPAARSWEPFRTDEILHHGVLLGTTDDVAVVHRLLSEVATGRSDLRLRNDDVVVNLWHGSHHTKVSLAGANLEIEFLSYIDDWGIDG